jgi:adenylate cyclase
MKGQVFSKGETINVPNAYADDRFNKAVDLKTGFKTNTILAVPVRDDANKIIGKNSF